MCEQKIEDTLNDALLPLSLKIQLTLTFSNAYSNRYQDTVEKIEVSLAEELSLKSKAAVSPPLRFMVYVFNILWFRCHQHFLLPFDRSYSEIKSGTVMCNFSFFLKFQRTCFFFAHIFREMIYFIQLWYRVLKGKSIYTEKKGKIQRRTFKESLTHSLGKTIFIRWFRPFTFFHLFFFRCTFPGVCVRLVSEKVRVWA